jgi:hypothetical protein
MPFRVQCLTDAVDESCLHKHADDAQWFLLHTGLTWVGVDGGVLAKMQCVASQEPRCVTTVRSAYLMYHGERQFIFVSPQQDRNGTQHMHQHHLPWLHNQLPHQRTWPTKGSATFTFVSVCDPLTHSLTHTRGRLKSQ